MKRTLIIVVLFIIVAVACTKSATNNNNITFTEDCSGAAKSFANDVSPVIQSSCATNSNCHGTGSNNGPGPLLTYNQVFTARSDIHSSVLSGLMPQGSSLTDAQKNAILCWIDSGASQN